MLMTQSKISKSLQGLFHFIEHSFTKVTIMQSISVNQLQQVQGGSLVARYAVVMAGAAFLDSLDTFGRFGRGLGSGFYDAIH